MNNKNLKTANKNEKVLSLENINKIELPKKFKIPFVSINEIIKNYVKN
jgi:hypothetical protein